MGKKLPKGTGWPLAGMTEWSLLMDNALTIVESVDYEGLCALKEAWEELSLPIW